MTSFVVQVEIQGKKREYIRKSYSSYRLKRDIEDNYPDILVVEIYPL